jgi:sugar phosphate isomerase/epimerase
VTWRLLNADWNYWPARYGAAEIWASCAELGFDGLEIGVYRCDEQLSRERLAEYADLAGRFGVRVEALLYSMPPARWPRGGLSSRGAPEAVADAVRAGEIGAQQFGLDRLGIWAGADLLDRSIRYRDAWARFVDSVSTITQRLERSGVRVAIEPKPRELVANTDAALRLCDAIGSPNLGILLDTGHALSAGEDLAVAAAMAGERLFHLHLDDTPGDPDRDLPPGRVHNFVPLLAALDAIGYRGAMTLDMYGAVSEGLMNAVDASREGRDYVRSAMADALGAATP